MKKIFEKFKDILYDSFDYVIMLVIVLSVVAVIGWRLDVLFAKDAKDVPSSNLVVEEPNKPSEDPDIPNEDNPDEAEDVDDNTTEEPPVIEEPVEVQPAIPAAGEKIRVSIPAGSLPGKIGSILAENGLIDSSKNFIAKAVELGLDTKLKSGTFDITMGSTYEEILKFITK